jgi:hypothetical protein
MNAGRAAIYAFREGDMNPSMYSTWDTYEARLARYALYTSYFNNTIYDELQLKLRWARQERKLYKWTRGLRNPVARLVDLRTSKCYGGSINYQDLSSGAIPILQADEALIEAIIQLFRWSNWGVAKSLYVRNGAMLGDSAIKIVDEPDKKKVRLEVLHPSKIKDVEQDAVGNVKSVVIEYADSEELSPGNVKSFTYREEIDGDWFRTFKDNKPFAYFNDEGGNPAAEWPNRYGFVPVAIAHDKDLGLKWGVNSFHSTITKIDDVNDGASALNDYLRKAMNPQWYAPGVKKKDELEASTEKRDQVPMIYGPEGSTMQSLVHNVDVTGALANLAAQMQELRDDLPELSLAELRDGGQLTAPGVRAVYSDAIDRLTEANGNYDDALIRAIQMAVTIGGIGKYNGFDGFNENSYANGDLDFYIKEREIVEDRLTRQDEITAWQQSGVPERKIWALLGATEDEIAEWEAEKRRKETIAFMMSQPNALPNGQQPAQLPSGETPKPTGNKLPTEQATDTSHLTDDHLASLFDEFQKTRGKVK